MPNTKLPPLPDLPMDRLVNFTTPVSWGITDPQRFQQLMEEAKSLVTGGYYLGDNLFTWCRNNSALEDPAFTHALQANAQNSTPQTKLSLGDVISWHAAHLMRSIWTETL